MNGTTDLKRPLDCTEEEAREFELLVRRGFEGSDEGLPGRIRKSRWLAFYYATGGELAAIAGLKEPGEAYPGEVFRRAAAPDRPSGYPLELGWVYVAPAHRGKGIAWSLCRRLLARAPGSGVFATTRANNIAMIRILGALGFVRAGRAYPRRKERLVLFLRPWPDSGTEEERGIES